MKSYYNEHDPFAAAWLRNLISEGLIASGDVDERSIVDVQPGDLAGYTQCHFFAGIGGWSYALRLAEWPDDSPVWTGSCPCQPLSGAGQRKGHADERHLWPAFYRLVAECAPAVVFGEQVASKDGREWLAGVRADLEALGYAIGAADLCAAGVGAPHIRQRLFWLAEHRAVERFSMPNRRSGLSTNFTVALDSEQQGLPVPQHTPEENPNAPTACRSRAGTDGRSHKPEQTRQSASESPDCFGIREQPQQGSVYRGRLQGEGPHSLDGLPVGQQEVPLAWIVCDEGGSGCGKEGGIEPPWFSDEPDGWLADAGHEQAGRPTRPSEAPRWRTLGDAPGCGNDGGWGSTWLPCLDGKARRVEPGIQPLANGISNRVGTLRGAGNAIVPQMAAEFIGAYLDDR